MVEIIINEFFRNRARWIHANVIMLDKISGRGWIRYSNVSRYYYLFKGIPQQAFIFERKLYEEFGGFDLDYPIVSDLDFHLRIKSKHAIPGKYVNIPMVIFATKGISGDMEKKKGERDKVLKKYFPRWVFFLMRNKLVMRLVTKNEVKLRRKSFFERILK
jgi:hypothetical protein